MLLKPPNNIMPSKDELCKILQRLVFYIWFLNKPDLLFIQAGQVTYISIDILSHSLHYIFHFQFDSSFLSMCSSFLSLLTSSLDPRKNKRVKTRQMNLQGALDEKYIRIYVAHETTACNTWPLFRSNIFLANMELLGHIYRVTFIIPSIYYEIWFRKQLKEFRIIYWLHWKNAIDISGFLSWYMDIS